MKKEFCSQIFLLNMVEPTWNDSRRCKREVRGTLWTFRLSGRRITRTDRNSPFLTCLEGLWVQCWRTALDQSLYVTLGFQLCLSPLYWGNSAISARPFLCPNLAALLFVPREIEGVIGSAKRGGEKDKGNVKASLSLCSHAILPPGFPSASLPLGLWPLCPHILDYWVPAFPDDWGPDS